MTDDDRGDEYWQRYARRMWWANKWLEFLHGCKMWGMVLLFFIVGGFLIAMFTIIVRWLGLDHVVGGLAIPTKMGILGTILWGLVYMAGIVVFCFVALGLLEIGRKRCKYGSRMFKLVEGLQLFVVWGVGIGGLLMVLTTCSDLM